MDKYIEFNPIKFLQDSRTWDRQIQELKKDLAAVSELKGATESPCKSTDISDPVCVVASQREKIIEKIEHINYYKSALSYAYNALTEPQKDAIDAFFFRSGHINHNARKVAQKYGYNYPKGIYSLRREALSELTKKLFEY